MFPRLALILGVAVLLLGLLFYSQWRGEKVTVSGTIEADEIRVGSLVGGRVERVLAKEGQAVKQGETLIELAPFDLRERRSEAAARLQSAQAEQARLEAGFRPEEIAQAQATRDQLAARLKLLITGPRPQEIVAAEARRTAAQADLRLAQESYDRTHKLFLQSASTQEKMDEATETQKAAEANLIVREQELALLKEGTREEEIEEAKAHLAEAEAVLQLRQKGYRSEEIQQAVAAVAAAQAALKVIDSQLAELAVKAPLDGFVEALDLQPGDLVSPRAPIFSIMDRSDLWLRTFVPLNRQDVQMDQAIEVHVDSFPGEVFPGRVTFISRQPEFTPSNAQTPEDRQKQVFRVKVSFTGDLSKLRPGMTGEILLGRE